MKHFFTTTAVIIAMSTSAIADVSRPKMESELRSWFTDFELSRVIDTRSTDSTVTAFLQLFLNRDRSTVMGVVTFEKLDSGKWYLMNFYADTGGLGGARLNNILREVDIMD